MATNALDDHSPDEIYCSSEVFDIDFHPVADIVALGTISGVVQVYVRSRCRHHRMSRVRNACCVMCVSASQCNH